MYGDPKFLIAHHDAVSAYGQLLSPDRRYTSIDTNLKGGFRGVEFNGMAMVADRDCPYDEIYFIDPSTISREELFPIGFLEEDGKILDRASTTAAWTATLAYYANLACFQPNRNAALRDVIK
jgi:hypothetical protein